MRLVESTAAPRISLPDDLVTEVLLRLPVRSIARFRCTCRSWNAETSSPGFLARHHALAPARLALVPLASAHTCETISMTMRCSNCPQPVGLKACRGFVLLRKPCPKASYSVCNPATGEVLRLPPSHGNLDDDRDLVSGIGFDEAAGVYKVVKVSAFLSNLDCQVLTLGDDAGWRTLPSGELGFTKDGVDGQFEVWRLRDYETGAWSLDYRIYLTGCRDETKRLLTRPWRVVPIRYLPGKGNGAGGGEKRKMLLATTEQAVHVYDPNTNTLQTVGASDLNGCQEDDSGVRLVVYKESLVRLPGMAQAKGEIEFVKLGALANAVINN